MSSNQHSFPAQVGSPSRKRSHAEITRSSSRSHSPDLPSKRRRTSFFHSSHPFLSSESIQLLPPRFERDGLDFRRPVMSTSQPHNVQDTIDLTGDDDDTPPPAAAQMTRLAPRRASTQSIRSISSSSVDSRSPRPPHRRRPRSYHLPVIDLSDDEDDSVREQTNPRADSPADTIDIRSSPEVEFVRERPVQSNPNNRNRTARTLPTPPALQRGMFGYLPELLRRTSNYMLGNQPPRARDGVDDVALDRIDGLQGRLFLGPHQDPAMGPIDDYDGINLDYRQPAFAVGNRSSEPPQGAQEPYKAPPPTKDGFTRNYEEESVLVCPLCHEELSFGKEDVKQQVWVVKACGHVYCGACATSRVVRAAGKKDLKKPNKSTTSNFRQCIVDDCKKSVMGKSAMFPVYL